MKKKSELKPVLKPARLADMPDILTLQNLADVLQTSKRGVYNITRTRAQDGPNALKILRLPIGLRVRKVDLENYLSAAAA